jgi:integrase
MAGRIRRRKRKDGTTAFTAEYPTGLRPSKKTGKLVNSVDQTTFDRKQDAEDWLTVQREAQLRGARIDPRKADSRFVDVLDDWEYTWLDLSPKTVARYQQIIRTHLVPAFGRAPVGSITHSAAQKFIAGLAKQRKDDGTPRYAPGTVRKVHRVMSSALGYAVKHRLIGANPCAGIRLPKAQEREAVFLTHEEVLALADAITPHYRVLVLAAAWTGMRAGELHALRHRDVGLDGRLHVCRALKSVDGNGNERGPLFGPPKNGKARTVRMPAALQAELAEYRSYPLPGGNGPDDLVFASAEGAPIRQNLFMRRHFKKAVKKALPEDKHGLTFHDLRHTCASLLIAGGANPKQVQEHLGHNTITVTMDRYAHLFAGHDDEVMEAFDAAITAAVPDNVTQLTAAEG